MVDEIERAEQAFEGAVSEMATTLAEVANNGNWSEDYRQKVAEQAKASYGAVLKERAKALMDLANGAHKQAIAQAQKLETDYDASFNFARLQVLTGETANRLASATPRELEQAMEAARATGDAHRVRATRQAVLGRAQAIAADAAGWGDQDRRVANVLARSLAEEGDTTPEIEAARQKVDDAKWRAFFARDKVKRAGERIAPRQFMDRSFFADALGEPPVGEVVWRRKDGSGE